MAGLKLFFARLDRKWWLAAALCLIVVLALVLRVPQLERREPRRGDARLYLNNARAYARLIEQRDWLGVLEYKGSAEQASLPKFVYAAGLVVRDGLQLPVRDARMARGVATVFSILSVLLLAIINPIAGLLMAVQTTHVLYTTEILLEAVPAFFSTLVIWTYVQYQTRKNVRWLYLCALALGITAAGKYIYAVAGIVILPFLLWEQRRQPWRIALFGVIAFGSFFLFNPQLWIAPVERLTASLQYHLNYSQSARVARSGRQWWWELGYLAFGEPFVRGNITFSFNTVIFILGWLGVPQLAKKNRVYLVWFIVALLFLIVWRTKWTQYALIFIPPMCLSAGLLIQAVLQWSATRFRGWQRPMEKQNV